MDRLLEFEPKQRLTEDAVVKMLSEAVVTSYRKAGVVGSSTEGHVSHVLASRMSSRPMGWSVTR